MRTPRLWPNPRGTFHIGGAFSKRSPIRPRVWRASCNTGNMRPAQNFSASVGSCSSILKLAPVPFGSPFTASSISTISFIMTFSLAQEARRSSICRPLRQLYLFEVQTRRVEVQIDRELIGPGLGVVELPRAVAPLFVVATAIED